MSVFLPPGALFLLQSFPAGGLCLFRVPETVPRPDPILRVLCARFAIPDRLLRFLQLDRPGLYKRRDPLVWQLGESPETREPCLSVRVRPGGWTSICAVHPATPQIV